VKSKKNNPLASVITACVLTSALIVSVCCCAAHAASSVPAPRLARSLSSPAAAAHAVRARHNEALKTLFAETGIPTGSDATNLAMRTRAIELINYAISNNVELADETGVTAADVAWAAGDFVGRYILGETQTVERLSLPNPRSSRWPSLRSAVLAAHPLCAACGAKATTVHHIIPFHLAPGRELDPDNLICLCDRCHFLVGHLGDWKAFNPRCLIDADEWLARCRSRPYGYDDNPSVLVIGDSHAACRLPHGAVDSWIVADLLGVSSSNRLAVSGSTAAQWASNQNGWLAAATNNRAPIIWISLGGNDVMAALADGRVTTDEARSAASNYYAVVRAVARGRRLVVATAYADPYQGARSDYALGLLILNSGIRMMTMRSCNELGVSFSILDEPDILGPSNYDGTGNLHPNAGGYTNMALRLRAVIKEQCK
jgi:lysophospholipase L1-like esterase